MQTLASTNAGYNWILTIVDLFSKYLWAVPLKHKTEAECAAAIKDWLESLPVHCESVQTDNGAEFKNTNVAAILKAAGVTHKFSAAYTPQSQGAVERVNGTLKRLLFAYMTAHNTKNWINALAPSVQNYNRSYHTTTKSTPERLLFADRKGRRTGAKNIRAAAKNVIKNNARLYGVKIVVGDQVRVALIAADPEVRKAKLTGIGALAKGYRTQYTKRLYTVTKVGRAGVEVSSGDTTAVYKKANLQKVSAVEKRPQAPVDGPYADTQKTTTAARAARRAQVAAAPIVDAAAQKSQSIAKTRTARQRVVPARFASKLKSASYVSG